MARGRREHDWGQTSEVLAMLFNANRGEKSPVKKPDDFNPYRRRGRKGKPQPVAEADVDILRVFVDGKLPTDVLSKIADPTEGMSQWEPRRFAPAARSSRST